MELAGEKPASSSQADPSSQKALAGIVNPMPVSDGNSSTSFTPEPGSRLETLLKARESMQEEYYYDMCAAETDRVAVPDQIFLDQIHRAQRAAEKGLDAALRRFKDLRKWRQKVKLTDGWFTDDDGNVVI
jgi:hypothetical protein